MYYQARFEPRYTKCLEADEELQKLTANAPAILPPAPEGDHPAQGPRPRPQKTKKKRRFSYPTFLKSLRRLRKCGVVRIKRCVILGKSAPERIG